MSLSSEVPRSYSVWLAPDDSVGDWVDISDLVTGFEMQAPLGATPTAKIDLVDASYDLAEGSVNVQLYYDSKPVRLQRDQRVTITEATGDSPEFDRVIMTGKVAEFAVGLSGTSTNVSMTLESPIAALDSDTSLDLLAAKAGPGGTVVIPTTTSTDNTKNRIFTAVQYKYPTTVADGSFQVKADGEDKQVSGNSMKAWFSPLSIIGVAGSEPPGFEIMDPEGPHQCWIRPFGFVRDVLLSCIEEFSESFKAENEDNITDEDAKKVTARVERAKDLLNRIEDKSGLIYLNGYIEYPSLLNLMIQTFLQTSGLKGSIWGVLTSMMKEFHIIFSPVVCVERTEIMNKEKLMYGAMIPTNPYREPSARLDQEHIMSLDSTAVPYRQLVRGTYAIYRDDDVYTTFKVMPETDFARIFEPNGDMWVLSPGTVIKHGTPPVRMPPYKAPELGRIIPVNVPLWFSESLRSAERVYKGNASDGDKPHENDATQEQAKDCARSLLNSSQNLLASAWAYEGRRSCTAVAGLVMFYSGFNPGDVLHFNTGDTGFTAVLRALTLSWSQQDKKYNVNLSLTHVTPINDPYYRALKVGFNTPRKDVLEIEYE